MNCPICAQALEEGELVMVCAPCHRTLGGGGLAVGATGEFRVSSSAQLLDHHAESSGEHPHATAICSWCGKLEAQVKKLLGR